MRWCWHRIDRGRCRMTWWLRIRSVRILHAELFLHDLGRRAACGDGSTVAGARQVRAFLVGKAGLDKDDFVFYDGSGLSGHDLVTPRATVRLLQYASAQPWFAAWKKSLPVGGVGWVAGGAVCEGAEGKGVCEDRDAGGDAGAERVSGLREREDRGRFRSLWGTMLRGRLRIAMRWIRSLRRLRRRTAAES